MSDVGAADSTAAAVTFNVTGIVNGLFEAPADVTVIVPFKVPAVSPDVLIDTLTARGVVPAVGVTCSHGAEDVIVRLDVPVEVILMFCVAGADAPSW